VEEGRGNETNRFYQEARRSWSSGVWLKEPDIVRIVQRERSLVQIPGAAVTRPEDRERRQTSASTMQREATPSMMSSHAVRCLIVST
jgi:hypothetical protein